MKINNQMQMIHAKYDYLYNVSYFFKKTYNIDYFMLTLLSFFSIISSKEKRIKMIHLCRRLTLNRNQNVHFFFHLRVCVAQKIYFQKILKVMIKTIHCKYRTVLLKEIISKKNVKPTNTANPFEMNNLMKNERKFFFSQYSTPHIQIKLTQKNRFIIRYLFSSKENFQLPIPSLNDHTKKKLKQCIWILFVKKQEKKSREIK
ncbi:hypothetical protein RFI_08341 [Reticulomyxa filosa]|uniref:Uncharacterized protein n=1 Tax=Reticulomyxa filosa TaxID=46433 RepID=X6NRZ9_RETFI|nr:hypothetical protein RFI_08341 [Reticulomyxa filosa]|eukprot:ETO28786.1 hypothetical protein RFI_08341 [Reticulomyxa filosa]